jgi:hypothetical protein
MITVEQAIVLLQKCNPNAELRIYFPNEDFSDSVESIQQDREEAVYLCGFPVYGEDIFKRSDVEVIDHQNGLTQIKIIQ